MLDSSKNRWMIAAVGGTIAMMCVCPLSLVGIGGVMLWPKINPKQDAAKQAEVLQQKNEKAAQKLEGDLAAFEKEALEAPLGVDGRTTFLPNPKITAPRPGTLRNHPWWTQPMTDAKIDSILFAISQLPVRQEMLLLGNSGDFSVFDDNPPTVKGDVCAILHENTAMFFFGASYFRANPPTSRAASISMLAQALDAGHLSSELHRKTGKGFSGWDQVLELTK